MRTNLGTWDRDIRLFLGCLLFFAGMFMLRGPWAILAVIAGLVLVVTAAAAFSPLYRLLGIDTRDTPAER
jgi:hypothetical protein